MNLIKPYLVFFSLFIFLLTGCTSHIVFDIHVAGMTNGVFIIKNEADSMIYSGNIKNGKLLLDKPMIERPGYYTINITDDIQKHHSEPFEIYLEPGTYHINAPSGDRNIYPEITSSSAIQKELTAFYLPATLLHKQRAEVYETYSRRLRSNQSVALPKEQFEALAKNAAQSSIIARNSFTDAFKDFIKRHPLSIASAHIMAWLDYENQPDVYYPLFKALSPAAQNSDEGKEIGDKLSSLVKLIPGAPAPGIAGTTPDGKPFKINELKKKIYFVEFWKAANVVSRLNHNQTNINGMLSSIPGKANVGVISISLENNRDWWISAIKEDKLTWPQYCDLKGNESINVVNWGISRIPTYYLVDYKWHIIERDIMPTEAIVVINQYLEHHP